MKRYRGCIQNISVDKPEEQRDDLASFVVTPVQLSSRKGNINKFSCLTKALKKERTKVLSRKVLNGQN